ncbi:hypothetical protein [Rhodopseudomonas palustris]|uniref:Histidine kinase n=1 Tax=Rhodopseudomonas palustris (strain BisB18) TaxID=316056 RepID=Q20ZZ9_RHOPB
MPATTRELAAMLDPLPAHVVLLDEAGDIVVTNSGWRRFARENTLNDHAYCVGRNYLEICEQAFRSGVQDGRAVADGIRSVLNDNVEQFKLDYPCHSPTEQRWFRINVLRLQGLLNNYVAVMHVDITGQFAARACD